METKKISNGDLSKKFGILGGGQLALLLTESIHRYGGSAHIYAQDISEPACAISDQNTLGTKDDLDKLTIFFEQSELVLLESEFYHPDVLKKLQDATKTQVFPNIDSYRRLFSKKKQKEFFNSINIPNVQSVIISSAEDLNNINFSGPYMLKLSTGGYDGYGNFEVSTKEELKIKTKELLEKFKTAIIVEQLIEIKNEFSALLVKNNINSVVLSPCQTFQMESVCRLVKFPADISQINKDEILKYMALLDKHLNGVGIYAFEFFEDSKGQILINEAAPRVHNSYHFTQEAYNKSQFDLFVEAVLQQTLSYPKLKYTYVSMVNLLGQGSKENYELNYPKLSEDYGVAVHMYGKKTSKPGRKLGHLTIFGDTENFNFARKINEEYQL